MPTSQGIIWMKLSMMQSIMSSSWNRRKQPRRIVLFQKMVYLLRMCLSPLLSRLWRFLTTQTRWRNIGSTKIVGKSIQRGDRTNQVLICGKIEHMRRDCTMPAKKQTKSTNNNQPKNKGKGKITAIAMEKNELRIKLF